MQGLSAMIQRGPWVVVNHAAHLAALNSVQSRATLAASCTRQQRISGSATVESGTQVTVYLIVLVRQQRFLGLHSSLWWGKGGRTSSYKLTLALSGGYLLVYANP